LSGLSSKFLVVIVLVLWRHETGFSSSLGWIEGKVMNATDSSAIEGVRVSISLFGEPPFYQTVTSTSGEYRFLGLPPDRYELSFSKAGYLERIIRSVRVQSDHVSLVQAMMDRKQESALTQAVANWQGNPADPWQTDCGTVLDRHAVVSLPSGRNIWSLIQNQDPSSVTNIIDEGGITSGTIALVGVLGGSWTQNGYRFDGLDITDPFETGKPLLYPDFGSLQEFAVSAASHAADIRLPGGYFTMTSRRGARSLHGEVEGYFTGDSLQGGGDNPKAAQDFTYAPRFKKFGEGGFVLGGPMPRMQKWAFLTSFGIQELTRIVPGFDAVPATSVYSGLVRLDGNPGQRDHLTATVAGQIVRNSNMGAYPGVAPSATLEGNDRFEVVQGHWTRRQSSATIWQLLLGFSHTSPTDTFQSGVNQPNQKLLFRWEMAGAAPLESDSARSRFSFVLRGQTALQGPTESVSHLIDFGLDLEESKCTEERRVVGDIQQLYYPDFVPSEVIRFNTPSRTKQRLREFALFLDDRARVVNWLFLRVGATMDASAAWLLPALSGAGTFEPARDYPGAAGVVSWTTISPHASFSVSSLQRCCGTQFSGGFARYHDRLPALYADYANPNSLGGSVLQWNDVNGDGLYQRGEEGALLRIFGGSYSSVDAGLRRPYTDEWSIRVTQSIPGRWNAAVLMLHRSHKRLVEDVNIGVPSSAYTPVEVLDLGDDNIQGTIDDKVITVFNQDPATLGQDRYLLTNSGFPASYSGIETIITKGPGKRGLLSLSFSAYRAVGQASPGNSEWQNDFGVIGTLSDNPNTLLHTRGRLFFDRAYVVKFSGLLNAPWGLQLGALINYFDGLPFGRRLIVTGLNQGPIFVMATPRGQPGGLRAESVVTFDQRVGRTFELGWARLTLLADIFNLLNLRRRIREYDISGPLFPLRLPLELQNPFVLRLGIRLDL
jgi:hypothetical protein